MEYKVTIDKFDGPLDLLLHLIKQSDIDIFDISIENVTKQYMNYIKAMEKLNLNIASEYLVMAAELIEMKSRILLPNNTLEESVIEEDPREKLINRLLEYKQYKEITSTFKELEEIRKEVFTKEPSLLDEYKEENTPNDIALSDLLDALDKFLEKQKLEQPISTKITKKEYSVTIRNNEIMSILKSKHKVEFTELFDIVTKEYIVVTFLSILDLFKKQELDITQDNNFEKIYLIARR